MKLTVIKHIKVILFILLSYLLISLIMAGILSLITIPASIYNIIIKFLSTLVICFSALYFFRLFNLDLILNLAVFTIFLIILCSINFNLLNMILKPGLFILINIGLLTATKKQH